MENRVFDIPTVVDTPDLVVWFHQGQGPRLVVSFSDVGAGDGTVPPMAFVKLATAEGAGHALFISDPNRSWMNAPGLVERIAETIEEYAAKVGAEEIVTIGNSMGGYAAALIPAFTKIDRAVSFSPQSTVHPEVAGDDLRWPAARSEIAEHRFRGLSEHVNPDTQYLALFGDNPREAPQYARFPTGDNVHVLMVPNQGHGLALFLKRRGVMKKVVSLAIKGRTGIVGGVLNRRFDAYWRRPDQADLDPVVMAEGALQRAVEQNLRVDERAG